MLQGLQRLGFVAMAHSGCLASSEQRGSCGTRELSWHCCPGRALLHTQPGLLCHLLPAPAGRGHVGLTHPGCCPCWAVGRGLSLPQWHSQGCSEGHTGRVPALWCSPRPQTLPCWVSAPAAQGLWRVPAAENVLSVGGGARPGLWRQAGAGHEELAAGRMVTRALFKPGTRGHTPETFPRTPGGAWCS